MARVGGRKAAPAAAMMLMLTGCAFSGQLQHIAIDQNQVVANTADSLALLNILRASARRPLHFTSISRISGNVDIGVSGGLGAGIALSGGGGASLSPTAGVSLASNPNFDITVHDSQAFQRGIMAPIAPEIINYYLRTGWRSDLITYLLVERVDFIAEADTVVGGKAFAAGEVIAALENNPASPAAVDGFRRFVACYTLSPSQQSGEPRPLKKFSEVVPVRLADLAVLDGAKFDLGPGPDAPAGAPSDWVVRKAAGFQSVGLTRTNDPGCAVQTVAMRGGSSVTARIDPAAATIGKQRVDVIVGDRKLPVTIDITFRSVDGLIYFLGEYTRAAHEGAVLYDIPRAPGVIEPLLLIAPGRGDRFALSAEMDGAAWHVPVKPGNRSLQVIALIEQLFNLHKAAGTAPLSTAVRVVN